MDVGQKLNRNDYGVFISLHTKFFVKMNVEVPKFIILSKLSNVVLLNMLFTLHYTFA